MYTPPYFEELRTEVMDELLAKYPLGALVYATTDGLDAVHLPFVTRGIHGEGGTLSAHVARRNPIWQELADGSEVLVIFKGPDAYVSPNWYPGKQETHRMVPTWNYQVVHVRGKIRFVHDVKALRASVALLTHVQEHAAGEENPWRLSDGEKDYIAQQLEAIVGVEIAVTSVTGKSKLSQNREERDKVSVVSEMRSRGKEEMAEAMAEAMEDAAEL